MVAENLNLSFDIPLRDLEDRISQRLNGEFCGYDRVVPLRQISQIDNLCMIKESTFEALIKSIPLRTSGGSSVYPYSGADIRVFGREPKGVEIGQTFVLDKKILGLMSAFGIGGVFSGFVTKGLSKMPPVQVYGIDSYGRRAIAFYVPPIVEIHGRNAVLIDGIHRSYLCNAAGTTINAVHINDVGAPLPFDPINWKEARLVSEKPIKEERYKNLKIEYFRDLSAVGIDG